MSNQIQDFNTQETARKTGLLTTVNASNNLWSALNNVRNDDPKEAIRSVFLATADLFSSMSQPPKGGEPTSIQKKLSILSHVIETPLILDRLIVNLDKYWNYRDFNHKSYNNGFIPVSNILDIVADTTTLAKKVAQTVEALRGIAGKLITPYSVGLDIVAALITTVSNNINNYVLTYREILDVHKDYINLTDEEKDALKTEWETKNYAIHKDEFSFGEVFGEAFLTTLTSWSTLTAVFEQVLGNIVPDGLNPFETPNDIDLLGSAGDDVINADSWFDDAYRIYGNGGNDTLIGGDHNDKILGGVGNDILNGKKGDDQLDGGTGYDTYHIADHDTIYDSDGKGQILFDGKALPKSFIKQTHNTGIWEAKDNQGNILYTAIKGANDLLITSTNSPADRVTIKDFFTIAHTNNQTHSALSIVLGDSQQDIEESVYTIKTDDKLHSIVYAGSYPAKFIEVIGSDKIDWINAGGSQKTLTADTQGGNDFIFGGDKGDIIKAGAGNDVIHGSSGFYDFADESKLPKPDKDKNGNLIGIDEDLIMGGLGNDLISGGVGNDTIWADDEYKSNGNIPLYEDESNPHNKNNPSEKGDWILGGRGNDFIHGSTNNDFLQGGADSDHIYGGGGNDVILGDGHIKFGNKTQTITSENLISYDPTLIGSGIHSLAPGVIGTTPTLHKGANLSIEYNYDNKNNKELITKQQFFNQRDRKVFEWDIKIDTELGDYKFSKQKDINLSEDYHLLDEKSLENTNDFLYGGKGDDLIIGQYGNDELWGNEGDDTLWGDDNRNLAIFGDDVLRGGSGKDTLIGGLGLDTYAFSLADLQASGGDDKIIKDSDNQGKIVINNQDLTGMEFFRVHEVGSVYQSANGQFELIRYESGNYGLSGKDFNAVITIKDTPVQNGTVLGMIFSEEVKNTAPIVQNAPKDQTLLAGQPIDLSFAGVFFDAEDTDDKLTYSLAGANGLTFNPDTKTLTGVAPNTGTFNLTLTAKDSKGLEASTSFKLTVNERPTVVSDLTLPTLSQDDESKQIDISHLFSDKEGDTLTYSLSAPSGIRLVGNTLSIDPKQLATGNHTLNISASDSFGQSVSTAADLTIKEVVTKPAPSNTAVEPTKPEPIPPTTKPSPQTPSIPSYNPAEQGISQSGKAGNDKLIGTNKADSLMGLLGNDELVGGLGNDKLYGGYGNDYLIGGKDNDYLDGGLGNDVYFYHKGDGLDTIKDGGGLDVLKITGLSLSDLGFVKQGKHLFIDTNLNDNNQTEGIVIENYFKPSPLHLMMNHTHSPVIEQLYVNGKLVGYGEIMDKLTVVGV